MKENKQLVPLNILLADDDNDDRFFFAKALQALSIPTKLTTVNDGEKLLCYLEKNSNKLPDILFLDLNMPKSDGLDVLRLIRKTPRLARVPVGVLTGSSATHDRQRASMSGAACYIEKPISYDEFIETVRHAVHDMLPPESADGREDVGGEEKQ